MWRGSSNGNAMLSTVPRNWSRRLWNIATIANRDVQWVAFGEGAR